MVETNQEFVGEQWIRNDDGVLPVSHEDKNITWISYNELLNTEFVWGGNSLSEADRGSGVPQLIYKDVVREAICKKNNSKTVGPSSFV